MTHDEARSFITRLLDHIARRDLQALDSLYDPDCVLESPTAGGQASGVEAVEKVYNAWFTAFPDLATLSEKVLVDGDEIVHVATLTGTDIGGFMGLPGSNKAFRIPVVFFYTLRDGRILQERRVTDFTGFLVQIGVLKAKPA